MGERGIIERGFGLGRGNEPQTLRAIGDDLRVSVRQMDTRAIVRLREAVGDDKLKHLVESFS